MESPLSQTEIQMIEAALINDLLANPIDNLRRVDAAILISQGRYFYRRKIDTHPLRYSYKSLSPDALRIAFNTEAIDSGWIAPGVVRCGSSAQGRWAVQFVPPARHVLEFSTIGKVTVPLPGLLFLGLEVTYWICAIASKTFDPQARCYQAPLPNVDTNSLRICWGTNTPPAASNQTITKAWNLFITSPFTSDLVFGKSMQHGDIRTFLTKLHRDSKKRYPIKTLLPIGSKPMTIEQLVQELLIHDQSS
jgi:hypothetical protein